MKRVVDSVKQSISATKAFSSGSTEKGPTDSPNKPDDDEPIGSRRTINLGGLEIPLEEGELNPFEKFFLRSTEFGDAKTVEKMIKNAKQYPLNVNCMDAMGRGVLRIAIEAEHIEMLQMLLSYEAIELGDSLLHAISEENVQAVEIIMQAQNDRQQRKNLKGLLGRVQSSSFTPDITPLILAAHRDNYMIIKLLLDRGNKIRKPHELQCTCNSCLQASREDSLQHSKLRINAYRALSSPCFIALSSADPILTAFELSWEARRLGKLENEFKEDYEMIANNCQTFAKALLAQTRGSAELAIVLNYHAGAESSEEPATSGLRADSTERIMQLSRLRLAIKYKQKQFVAHPHCQQLLASLWYEDLPGFRQKHFVIQAGTVLLLFFLYPILSMFYLLAPESRVGGMLRKPFIKFICQSSAYVSFLLVLTLLSLRIEFIFTNSIEARMSSRAPSPSLFEWIAIVYILGFIWQEITDLWMHGLRAYIGDMWHILDFAQNSLFISTIALRLAAFFRVRFYGEQSIMDRSKWDAYDPILISESIFAIANIFATLKLVYVFTLSPKLGPLQISLGRMLNDIMKFFCVYILVLIAFAFGLNQLYWFYARERSNSCADVRFSLAENEKDAYEYCVTQGRYFTNLFEIAQALYWAAYGLIDLSALNLEYPHYFTEFIGKLIFGTYSYIAFIVLLNMLIAMMNTSYQQIWEQADTEWKFARSKMWISYFGDGSSLPVPFNLLPSRNAFSRLISCCHCPCDKESDEKNEMEWQSIRERVRKVNEKEKRHATVMRELINRYLMFRQMNADGQGVTEDDLNEIKGDISSFRYELLDILRENGMKVNTYDNLKKGGRLRRRASRRGKTPSWRGCNINLDDLPAAKDEENVQAPGNLNESDVAPYPEYDTPVMGTESVSMGGQYVNQAFVPEIAVTRSEDAVFKTVLKDSQNYGAADNINFDAEEPEEAGKECGKRRSDFV